MAADRKNYRHLAAGNVIVGRASATNFPVRLADELFARCIRLQEHIGQDPPYHVYDPCCGTGYLLTVLGFLYGDSISQISASDCDAESLKVAAFNLSLLTPPGLRERESRLRELVSLYNKESHAVALMDLKLLRSQHLSSSQDIETTVFPLDVLQDSRPPLHSRPDILIADIPYGTLKKWKGDHHVGGTEKFLNYAREAISPAGICCVIRPRKSEISAHGMVQVSRFRRGHREVTFLRRAEMGPASGRRGR